MSRKPKPDFYTDIMKSAHAADLSLQAVLNSPVVYLVRSGDTSWIKIGYTNGQLDTRLANEQTGNPEPLKPVGIILHRTADGAHAHEQSFHDRYDAVRGLGEWFKIPTLAQNLAGVRTCRDLKRCGYCEVKGMSKKARDAAMLASVKEAIAAKRAEQSMRRRIQRLVRAPAGPRRRSVRTSSTIFRGRATTSAHNF
jgi:T5orf172 domain